jgi:hypothetical protein
MKYEESRSMADVTGTVIVRKCASKAGIGDTHLS